MSEDARSAIEKIGTALGLFASCIKSGEAWSATCEQVQREAREALARIAEIVSSGNTRDPA